MELRSGRRLRSSEQLGEDRISSELILCKFCCDTASAHQRKRDLTEDRISALPDDLLLLILARLGCIRTAVRTGVLARRWSGLWARLRHIVFRDVPFPLLEGALRRVPRPPPAVSLLEIRVPQRRHVTSQGSRVHAASTRSLLRAAARLEPKELVFLFPSGFIGKNSPMLLLGLPADVTFAALQMLSLYGCHVRFDSLLLRCPHLRVLRLKFSDHVNHEAYKTFMSVHSASLQELFVEAENMYANTVDLATPELKQLTVSLKAYRQIDISILAPMVEEFSWQWSYLGGIIKFGLWRIVKLRLQRSERHGDLSSLHIHARITSSIVHGEVENSMQEIEKHMIAKFSVLELHLKTKGHVFGALVLNLLGMNRFFTRARRIKVTLQRSAMKQECPLDCTCDHPEWRSQTISLTALEEAEINGFEGYNHEIDFLKLVFKCAPMLKRMIVVLSHEVSSHDDGYTQIHNIFNAYSSVECYLYLSSGLMHSSDDCPPT